MGNDRSERREMHSFVHGDRAVERETDAVLSAARSCLMIADRSTAWRDERDKLVDRIEALMAARGK